MHIYDPVMIRVSDIMDTGLKPQMTREMKLTFVANLLLFVLTIPDLESREHGEL